MNRMSTIFESQHHEEIHRLLRDGWPYRHVHESLVAKYGPDGVPSASAIQRYRDKHIRLSGSRSRISNRRMLNKMIRAQERRIAHLEQLDQQERPQPQLDAAFRTLLTYLRERDRITERLAQARRGPRAEPEPPEDQPPEMSEADLREILDLLRRHAPQDGQEENAWNG